MLGFVIGTRPEIIKMSALIKRHPQALVIHTGQHYSPDFDGMLLDEYHLMASYRVPMNTHGSVADNYARIAATDLKALGVTVAVTYGDTLSAAAMTMAAKAQGLKVVHVEAGLR